MAQQRYVELQPFAEWLANGRHGISSLAIASVMLGGQPEADSYPKDPDDLRRCVLLLDAMPAWRQSISLMGGVGPVWAILAGKWFTLESVLREECGGDIERPKANRGPAERTYDIMKQLISSAGD